MAQLPNKVFVGSLPSNTKPEALRHIFEKHGEVVQCDVVNRCGFVYMQTAEMVEKCVKALNGTDFKGNKIVVEVGRPEKKAPEAAAAAAAVAPKPKRPRQRVAKAPIRAVANNTIVGKKQRGRGGLIGGPNPGGFPAGISPDVKEAVTMRLAGAIMELFKENPNALFESANNGGMNMNMPHAHPKGGNFMGGGGNGPVGPRGPPQRQMGGPPQRQVGGPPPGKRPDKVPRNNDGPQLFTRRPMPAKVEKPKPAPQGPIKGKVTAAAPAAQGPIKGKVTAGPPQDLKKRPRRPAEWKPKRPDGGPVAGPGPRPNGLPRRNEGFNNAPNMNYANGPMGGGSGPGRGMGGGNAGPHNNNTNTYVWRNENLNNNRGGQQGGMVPNGGGPVGGGGMGGGGGGGGGGGMGRGYNDNFANNSNSMFNQGGGGGGGGNQAMGQDRRGFALPNYQHQQQQHQQSAFLQSNFDGVMNPGGFTTGVSNVVNNGGRRAGPAGGNPSSFSSGYNGQNMNYDNRGGGGGGSGFRSGGFGRGMDNMDNGGGGGMNSGGFGGGFDSGSMPRGNFNFSNSSKMFDDDISLGSNRNNIGGGNMYSSGGGGGGGGFNRNNDMDMNHMNRNTDQWSMMNNRRFN